MGRTQFTSPAWDFFPRPENTIKTNSYPIQCKICGTEIVYVAHSTGNLIDHIRRHHGVVLPKLYTKKPLNLVKNSGHHGQNGIHRSQKRVVLKNKFSGSTDRSHIRSKPHFPGK